MPRVFVGSFITPEDQQLLKKFAEQNDHLCQTWARKIRWVRSEKLHMTWLFIGDVKHEDLPGVQNAMQEMMVRHLRGNPITSIDLSFTRAEIWPNKRKPRQLVLVTDVIPDTVSRLAADIKRALKGYISGEQEAKDDRPYRPHLTLGRFDQPHKGTHPQPLEISAIDCSSVLPLRQQFRTISLVESFLGPKGEYQPIMNLGLGC